MAPHGHTISVSDIWLVAHYYGILTTVLGEVSSMDDSSVRTINGIVISCTALLKCTGYWKNELV